MPQRYTVKQKRHPANSAFFEIKIKNENGKLRISFEGLLKRQIAVSKCLPNRQQAKAIPITGHTLV